MKVAIITEGNNKTGYGHLTRCLSVYQAFEEKEIIPVYIANYWDEKKTILPEINLYQLDWIYKSKKLLDVINGFDIAIIDSYLAPLDIYEQIRNTVKKAVYFDDYIRLNYPPGIIINGTIGAENLSYKKDNKHQYLLGINYMPLRKEFWDIDIPNRNKNKIKNVLITFGGQNLRNLTSKVVNYLVNEFPRFNYHVVIGNKNNINTNKSRNIDYYYTLNAKEMLRLMLKCDIAISAAGQTTYELVRTGLRTMAIGVADNQKYNMNGWLKSGFLEQEIWINQDDLLVKIKEQIKKNVNNQNIYNKSYILCDGQGARRIIKSLLKNRFSDKFYLRKFKKNDIRDIYELSSEKEVREVSINPAKFTLGEHIKWFKNTLFNKNAYYLVAKDYSNKLIGQIKFDILNEKTVISISITKEFRGKGFASEILKISCNECFKNFPNVLEIRAYILENNIKSVKSFKNAGFKYLEDEIIKTRKFKLFFLNRNSSN